MSNTLEQSPEQVLRMVNEAQAESESKARDAEYREAVKTPPDMSVELPGGLWDIDGSVRRDAEVRELNGFDEEAIAKLLSRKDLQNGEVMREIVMRCTLRVGDQSLDRDSLDMLYVGDWDALLLGIRIASFGPEVSWTDTCPHCSARVTIIADLREDVEVQAPKETEFTYEGRRAVYRVGYPRGSVTSEILRMGDTAASAAAAVTETLYGAVISIDGSPAEDRSAIRRMPTADREGIMRELSARMPRVLLGEVKKDCPECGVEVPLPMNIAALFQGRVPGL